MQERAWSNVFWPHLSPEGLKTVSDKIIAVSLVRHRKKMQSQLKTVLGMTNYLVKVTPHLADVLSSLKELLKESSDFKLECQQNNAFDKMKPLIANFGTLSYYDKRSGNLHWEVQKKIGGTLLQEQKPVLASKSLTAVSIKKMIMLLYLYMYASI